MKRRKMGYEKAEKTLRIAQNWLLEAAKDLEDLKDCTANKHARELRGAALMIDDWRSEMAK